MQDAQFASLASTHQIPVAPPVVTTKSVSRHYQVSPWVENHPLWRTTALMILMRGHFFAFLFLLMVWKTLKISHALLIVQETDFGFFAAFVRSRPSVRIINRESSSLMVRGCQGCFYLQILRKYTKAMDYGADIYESES